VYEFANKRKLCAKCFIRYFEKKILYTIRKFNLIKKSNIIYYQKNSSLKSAVLENILKMIAEKGRIKLTNKKPFDKIAVPSNTDSTAEEIINSVINKKLTQENYPKAKNIIKPLYLMTDKEIQLYAKIKKLKYKKIKSPDKSNEKLLIANFINSLERSHPEIKNSIIKSYLKLYF
jgi:hypothetical protein